tara:strand:- start:548 stop:784 length:237 start_codon:yes stop_codon:yes gene_type:complete
MLSSIILSMAMSVTPAQVEDINNLDIQEVGARRGTRRLSNEYKFDVEKVGARRGTRRLSNENDLIIETVGARRGTRRL